VLSVVFNMGWGVRALWVSMFGVFWFLFGVVLDGCFWPQVSVVCVCVCVCVCTWLDAFGISTGEKHFSKVKECKEAKPIWCVSFVYKVSLTSATFFALCKISYVLGGGGGGEPLKTETNPVSKT